MAAAEVTSEEVEATGTPAAAIPRELPAARIKSNGMISVGPPLTITHRLRLPPAEVPAIAIIWRGVR